MHLDYTFDRLLVGKLAHAYALLVPARTRSVATHGMERPHADGGDLHARVLGATTRSAQDPGTGDRRRAETLDIVERQRIVRLLVKEVLVNDDTIVIRHSIPVPSGPSSTGSGPNGHGADATDHPSYLLRSGRSSA